MPESRLGVVDVGSNSVRLVVFEGATRSPAYFFNEKVMCGLGDGLPETGRLSPGGRSRALAALKRFKAISGAMGLSTLQVVATAAVRDARDGQEFRNEVARETGLDMRLIDGDEEARLSAQGVLLGWPEARGLVCDIGGLSLELAEIRDGRVGARTSSALGPLKLRAIADAPRRREHVDGELARMFEALGSRSDSLFLVGGAWRTIARLDMARRNYPLRVLHEYRMSPEHVRETLELVESLRVPSKATKDLLREAGVSENRARLAPEAAEALSRLVAALEPRDIAISSYGIREGLLWENMPPATRGLDPLIEACKIEELRNARRPGFGRELFGFVRPILETRATPDERGSGDAREARETRETRERRDLPSFRIAEAACLLHDVCWRAHPDYRAEACFEYVTRANLCGIGHGERATLGLGLMHRYRSAGLEAHLAHAKELATAEDCRAAEALGRAMRLGAALWAPLGQRTARLSLDDDRTLLTLWLHPDLKELYSEIPGARLAGLARALGANHAVEWMDPGELELASGV